MQPVIKWSGSKRSQASSIISYINKNYNTYYEPFCGSCAVLAYIIEYPFISYRFHHFICSDLNQDLINSYNLIKQNPNYVIKEYTHLWNELNKINNSIEDKKNYYNYIRTRLNKEHNPCDFIFIMRTAINGMPRYNKNGEFNSPFHITRNGILPEKFHKIVLIWSHLLNVLKINFDNMVK